MRARLAHQHNDGEVHSPSGSYPLANHQYRNEVPQHHHRDLLSSGAVWHSSVLSHQHGWGCVKFGTKRPQVQILSPRPVPQVADLRECRTLRAVSHFPATATEPSRQQKGTRGNSRESRSRLRRADEHPASQQDAADPAAQGPSVHCDPQSATKRHSCRGPSPWTGGEAGGSGYSDASRHPQAWRAAQTS